MAVIEVEMDRLHLLLSMDITLQAVVPHTQAAIALAAERLSENSGIEYEAARSALQARENLGSTALGHGVAMPHAASKHCLRPAAALVSLSSPINFDAPDGQVVDLMFALIWPQNDAQGFLGFLSLASRLMRDPAMLLLIRSPDAPEAIRNSLYYQALAIARARTVHMTDQRSPMAPRFQHPITHT